MACIRKRKNKWVVDYRIGDQRKNPSFDSKFEAEAFKRELLLRPIDMATGYQKMKPISVKDCARQYLETVTPKKSERTWAVDTLALEKFSEYFVGTTLWELGAHEVEAYQLHLLRKLNPATVNRRFNVIRNFFRKCVEWKHLRENPTSHLKRLPEVPKQKVLLSANEISRLLSAMPEWAANVVYFVAKTGVRRGEACSLKWSDVDFARREISVQSKKGGVIRNRIIPLTDDLFGLFIELFNKQQKAVKKCDSVFLGPIGNAVQRANLSKAITNAGKKLNLMNAGLHVLRHTILTGLAEQNQSGSTIQKLAGHSSLVTSQKYIHHSTATLKTALEGYESKVIVLRPRVLSESVVASGD